MPTEPYRFADRGADDENDVRLSRNAHTGTTAEVQDLRVRVRQNSTATDSENDGAARGFHERRKRILRARLAYARTADDKRPLRFGQKIERSGDLGIRNCIHESRGPILLGRDHGTEVMLLQQHVEGQPNVRGSGRAAAHATEGLVKNGIRFVRILDNRSVLRDLFCHVQIRRRLESRFARRIAGAQRALRTEIEHRQILFPGIRHGRV
jgi:hypothetical protein